MMKAGVLEIGSCGACGKLFSVPADPPKMEVIQDRWGGCFGPALAMQYTCPRCGYVWRDYIEEEKK
jgi:uncharacterized Zn finger protein